MLRYDLVDNHGRKTTFYGTLLGTEGNPNDRKPKPSWLESSIYRTAAGQYVVTHHRRHCLNHADESCGRITSEFIVDADPARHILPCRVCGGGSVAQEDRVDIDVFPNAHKLVAGSISTNGLYSSLSKLLLTTVSAVDAEVSRHWMTVEVD